MRAGQRRPVKKSRAKKSDTKVPNIINNLCDQVNTVIDQLINNSARIEEVLEFHKIKDILNNQSPICDRILANVPDIKEQFENNQRVFTIFFKSQTDLLDYLTTAKNIPIQVKSLSWNEFNPQKDIPTLRVDQLAQINEAILKNYMLSIVCTPERYHSYTISIIGERHES
jgi:hypothetical protein